jgi:hypothetical protein
VSDAPWPPAPPDVTWITLDELKAQLYITHTWDDPPLTKLLTQASTAILIYLGPRGDATWTPTSVPADIGAAVLKLAVAWWAGRGNPAANDEKTWTEIRLLLERRRDPALL